MHRWLLRNLLVLLLLRSLRERLLVTHGGVLVDGLSVTRWLTHWVLSLLLLLLDGLSSDRLLRLLVVHLDNVDAGVVGVVAADRSVVFGYATSAFSSGDAGDNAEDEEE